MEKQELLGDIIQGNNMFTAYIYKRSRQIIASEAKNVLLSPLNIHSILVLIFQDPGYRTSDLNVLFVPDVRSAADGYKDILAYLNSFNGAFSISNKVFLNENCHLQEHFLNVVKNNFYSEVEPINFCKSENAAKSINAWVEDKTNKRTSDLIDASALDVGTRLALVNAMQFNDNWAEPFNAADTTRTTFYLNATDTVEVEMMRAKREVYYKSDEYRGLKILELPYANSDFRLVLVLPDEGKETQILERFHDYYIFNDMIKCEVDISIPRFKIELATEYKQIFNQIGLTNEFSDNATLFGMIDNDEFLSFDKIQKKATINVNEAGTSAASGIIFTTVPNKTIDEEDINTPSDGLIIYEMDIKSNVTNRFAKTLITCKVRNTNEFAKETTFSIVLPETAFISEFIMEIGEKIHKAYIKEKSEAKTIYNEALISGRSAGIVEADASRDSNEFAVSVNLEPHSVAIFLLTYEEMLQRIQDQYELVLNIRPGQVVERLNVEVKIEESRPLKFVRTPSVRSGNEMSKDEKYLKPSTDIKITNAKSAIVKFTPDSKQQRKFARYLGSPVSGGFSGQFVVQYDVERDPQGGEILLQDGYFVHFFAPNDLDPLPKHVVFVLDTSSSMGGRKISQLKDAMMSILDEIRKQDIISIIEFNSNVIIWDIQSETSTVLLYDDKLNFKDPFSALSESTLPDSAFATDITINKAKNVVRKIVTGGWTYMIGGLETALYLVKKGKRKNEIYQPIIVFLTDGEPNVGMESTEEIVETVTQLNLKNDKVPIFSLSFGDGADKTFLRRLSLKNLGFARHIYEASDASMQLQAFYKQISSPLLSDVKFKYESETKEVTKSHFSVYFRGSELVVSGRYNGSSFPTTINGCGPKGSIILRSSIERPVASLERLWAFLTVKQLLEERNSVEDKTELTKRAVDLALKYSFVTEVTSLIVVNPTETNHEAITENVEGGDCGIIEELPEQAVVTENIGAEGVPKKKCIKKRIIKKRRGDNLANIEIQKDDGQEGKVLEQPIPIGVFLADRPFLITLKYKKENRDIILFTGHVCKPY